MNYKKIIIPIILSLCFFLLIYKNYKNKKVEYKEIYILQVGAYKSYDNVINKTKYLDNYIIYNAAEWLNGMPAILYAPCNYLLHIVLSVLVPSSSGIASLSTPIMGPLTAQLGFSVEVNVMILVAANGLVNLITPTCGAIMGGLALARVEYSTWFKWAWKLVAYLGLASMVILTLGMIIF